MARSPPIWVITIVSLLINPPGVQGLKFRI